MREIVLDTETTGLDPRAGHRVVEIGCVELANHVPTGRTFHRYLDPERDMPAEALAIHGITDAMLRGKPKFAEVAEEFLEFVTDAALVIHNAEFDLRFLNWELENAGRERLNNRVVDTMIMARQKYPGAQASLDALCKRFEIDLSGREKHGALLDGQLLAQVYLEMVGGRQPGLDLAGRKTRGPALRVVGPDRPKREPRLHLPGAAPTPEEAAAHDAFVAKMKDPLWRRLGGG